MDLETFNADLEDVRDRITDRTLALLLIPMFGLPCDVEQALLMTGEGGAFLVEDAASALGSRVKGGMSGTCGDVGFISFNRGKNLSTVSGGAILTDREDVYQAVVAECDALPRASRAREIGIRARAVGLALAVRPLFYTLFNRAISRFKYTSLHADFEAFGYTDFQARLGTALLERAQSLLTQRHKNGILWSTALSGREGIAVPRLVPGARAVFNQFPILLPDQRTRDAVHQAVLGLGIEATVLYPDPIHRLYPDVGGSVHPDAFPRATDMAQRILLLPTHPLVGRQRALDAAEAIARVVGSVEG